MSCPACGVPEDHHDRLNRRMCMDKLMAAIEKRDQQLGLLRKMVDDGPSRITLGQARALGIELDYLSLDPPPV